MDSGILMIIIVIVSVLISITLHEAMHAFTSHWLGDDTAYLEGRLTLNPLKHIDPILTVGLPVFLAIVGAPIFGAAKPVPFNPARVKYDEYGAALVGIAGPLTNLVLAIVGALLLRAIGLTSLFSEVLYLFIAVNIGFFVFNMIPFPPLDGSRVLYSVAPEPVQRVMSQLESLGLAGIAIFLFLLFPVLQPILITAHQTLLRLLVGI